MTTDERLDKLTERHEALALNLELESVNIARLREIVQNLGVAVDRMGIKVDALVESVHDLVRVARMHDARIFRLEEQS